MTYLKHHVPGLERFAAQRALSGRVELRLGPLYDERGRHARHGEVIAQLYHAREEERVVVLRVEPGKTVIIKNR